MNKHLSEPQSQTYVPAVGIVRATLKHSTNKLPVCPSTNTEQICGEARRIGYTGKQDHDMALYRLKIRVGQSNQIITLPGYYLIEDGLFQEYEQWKQKFQ